VTRFQETMKKKMKMILVKKLIIIKPIIMTMIPKIREVRVMFQLIRAVSCQLKTIITTLLTLKWKNRIKTKCLTMLIN